MKYILIISGLLFMGQTVFSQEIRGRILEQSKDGPPAPLAGVNIYWLNTQRGVVSNPDGYFTIEKPAGNTPLVISYVGFKSDTVFNINEDSFYEVLLQENLSIEAVEVTGRQKGTYMDRLSPLQKQVISSSGLQQAACCNLSESFETSASVDVNYTDAVSGAKQIIMLGLAGKYSQIMTENIPNLRGLGTTYGLGYIPGSWMESVQVSKGSSSVLNGFESITGQINVEYKKPEDSERLFINLYGNDHGKLEANLNSAVKLNNHWSTMLLAHGETAKIKSDANGDGFLDSPVMNQINFMNSWKYQGSKGFESRFGFKVINESRTGGQLTFNRNQEINTSNGYGITLDTRRYEGYLKMGYVFANRPGTSVGFINSAYHHDQGSVFGLNRYKGLHESFSSTLLFQSFIGNTFHGFTAGVSYLYDSYEESLNDSIFNRIEAVPGAFFQYTYQPGEKMTLMAGLRGDYHNLFSFMLTPRLHFRYNLTKGLTLRASIGKGYRTANVIAENSALLASSRSIRVIESPEQEIAWNYGLNLSHRIEINGREMLFSAEYYRTDFQNQVIVDLEHDISLIRIYNLDGKSYSNAYQFDFSYEPIRGLDLKLGYRITDVKTTIDDMLIEKPLVNRHKGLINTSYITRLKKWQFDLTLHINGMGRLASTSALPQEYQRNETFPTYTILNGQLTKRFKYLDLYLGSENITNFKQEEPILASADPFGPYFDASMVWGPIRGRMFYMGIRIDIK